MICPQCETELTISETGKVSCQDCGLEFKNILAVMSEKLHASAKIGLDAKDELSKLQALMDMESALTEAIDALTNGAVVQTGDIPQLHGKV